MPKRQKFVGRCNLLVMWWFPLLKDGTDGYARSRYNLFYTNLLNKRAARRVMMSFQQAIRGTRSSRKILLYIDP